MENAEIKKIFQEINKEIFKTFKKLDQETKTGILTGSVACWGFRNEEKARKFIDQTHVVRGNAIEKLLIFLENELRNGEKYYLSEDSLTLKKEVEDKNSILLDTSSSDFKESIIGFIKKNWSLFPIGINIYDRNNSIAKLVTTPDFIINFKNLSLVEKLDKLPELMEKSKQEYVEIGTLSDKLLDSLIFKDISKEIENINNQEADKIFKDLETYKFDSYYYRRVKAFEDLVEGKINSCDERRVYKNFIFKMNEFAKEDNIINLMLYMMQSENSLIVLYEHQNKLINTIKTYMFNLNKEERDAFVKDYGFLIIKKYQNNKSIVESLRMETFFQKLNIKYQVEKREVDYESFIEEDNEKLFRKNLTVSKIFCEVFLKFKTELVKNEKIILTQVGENVKISFFTDFEITIGNRELLELLSNTITESIKKQRDEVDKNFYVEYNFDKDIVDMFNKIRVEQKIRTVDKEEFVTKPRGKI